MLFLGNFEVASFWKYLNSLKVTNQSDQLTENVIQVPNR